MQTLQNNIQAAAAASGAPQQVAPHKEPAPAPLTQSWIDWLRSLRPW